MWSPLLRVERHDDVTRLVFASRPGRALGYTVSAYVVAPRAGSAERRPVLVDTGFPRARHALVLALVRLARERRADGGAWASGPPDPATVATRREGRGPAGALDAEAFATGLRELLAGAVVTHAHEDHAGNAALLQRMGVPLAMGDATRALLAARERVGLYRRVVWGTMTPLDPRRQPPFDPAPLALVPAPGHSPDHHVAWDAERETVFGGDLFIGVRVRIAHLWEDPRAHVRALRAVAALRPRRYFDAHRGPVDAPVAALEAKAAWMEDRVADVERLLDRGWPARRVRAAVFGREELTGLVSCGAYSRTNFVRAVRRTRAGAAPPLGTAAS